MKSKEHESRELTCEELTEVLRDAHQEILGLQARLAEYEWVETALRKRTRELGERVKELECLYAISHCLCRPDADLAEMLQDVLDILPKGYQNPKKTWAHLEVFGESFFSSDFQTTPDSHAADIIINFRRVGVLRVYVAVKPGSDEAPLILPMEEALLQAVALWIGKTVEHWQEAKPGEAKKISWWSRSMKKVAALIRPDLPYRRIIFE
ncbi:MAG: hypothetical protein PHX53_01910 [Syntrophales bacterium]|nr:hypothetical protein [Syntrophales bacterium]